ncbi:class I SAM-dependent methyltransferase [Halorubrum sp. DTA46]|uniref:class I SAM-dependent methyltransferase n=1 Tax=Halorubrum sp. DTA46 TaxID=3402162 RepID=UPI003AAB4FA8
MVALTERNFTARAKYLYDIAQRSVGPLSGDRCLMIGAGSGHNTEIFGEGYEEVHALDIGPQDYPNIVDHSLIADGTQLPYEDDSFELCAAISVVEHVLPPANRDRLVNEMVRCTKPGGTVFLQVPNGQFPLELHTGLPFIHWLPGGKQLAIRRGHTTLKQVHIPSRSQLEKWVRDAGAEIITSKGITYPKEAIPKYHSAYEILKNFGAFRLFPFGYVIVGRVP